MTLGMTAWGVVFGLAGIIMFIITAFQAARVRFFTNDSEEVAAKVTKKYTHRRKNGRSFELTLEYSVDGTQYKKMLEVNSNTFSGSIEGAPITILYKPNNPKRIAVPSEINARNIRILLIVSAALTAIGVALFFIGRK